MGFVSKVVLLQKKFEKIWIFRMLWAFIDPAFIVIGFSSLWFQMYLKKVSRYKCFQIIYYFSFIDESSIKTVRRSTSHRKPNQLAITSTTSDNFKNKSEKLPPETANQKTDGKNEVKSKLSESKTQTNNVKPETLTSKVLSDSQLTSKVRFNQKMYFAVFTKNQKISYFLKQNENLSENKEENSLKKSPSGLKGLSSKLFKFLIINFYRK